MSKIPIHFGSEDERELNELIEIFGLSNSYGAVPKTVKLSIRLVKYYLISLEKVIPNLKVSEIATLLDTLKKLKTKKYEFENEQKKGVNELKV